MIDKVEEMVTERLRDWQKYHKGELPAQILYYRDGVSEGELSNNAHLVYVADPSAESRTVRPS
jgi:hypothetical protein